MLDRAARGEGGPVGIVGEAGVGKSRLCSELVALCERRGIQVARARCQAHAKNLPLVPVRDLQRVFFGVDVTDSDQTAREKIGNNLLSLDERFADDLVYLYEFLSISDPAQPPPPASAEARRRRLIDVARRVAQAHSDPVVMIIEDLHWNDPESEAFLENFVQAIRGTSWLLVTNFRPEYRGRWTQHSNYRQIPLAPLDESHARGLLAELLGDDPSLDGLAEMIYERTSGNPFFTEETVRELEGSGALAGSRGAYRLVNQIEDLSVPANVQSVLAARIDRLSPKAKSVLGVASVVGHEFGLGLLARVTEFDSQGLQATLDELVDQEFVQDTGLFPDPQYTFRHPLTREVAYNSQLAATRARTHAATAAALRELKPDQLDEQAALIGLHYERAGDTAQAVDWYSRSATWNATTNQFAAYRTWDHVCELSDELPDGPEHDAIRLGARTMLLNLSWRVAADEDEVRAQFARGEEIARRLGDNAMLATLNANLGSYAGNSAGYVTEYAERCEKALELLDESVDPRLRVVILASAIYPRYLVGRHAQSIAVADEAIALCDGDPGFGGGIVTTSPLGFAHSFRAMPMASIGQIDGARRTLEQGIEICRKHDPESLSWSFGIRVAMAIAGTEEFDAELVGEAREAAELARRHGDAFSQAVAETWLGAVLGWAGEHDAASHHLQAFFALMEERNAAKSFTPYAYLYRAFGELRSGEFEACVADAEAGIQAIERQGHITIGAFLQRTLAEGLLGRGLPGDLDYAAAALDECERVARAFGLRIDLAGMWLVRARLHLARGEQIDYETAIDSAEREAREIDAHGLFPPIEEVRRSASVAP